MKRTLLAIIATAALAQAAALPSLLDTAAKAAEREAAALSSVACTETVIETKINQKDKAEEHRRQVFDYLVLLDTDDGDVAITESRVAQGNGRKSDARPLLQSTGFATLMMILHPYYQNSFEFSDLGSVEDGGRLWRRLGFESRPGERSPSILRAGAREYPLGWKGEALIDELTGQVATIHASLGSQLEEIGLESLEATVRYGPAASDAGEWLPIEAVIDLKTHHQHWHNVHDFADYRRFDVTTSEKREVPQ